MRLFSRPLAFLVSVLLIVILIQASGSGSFPLVRANNFPPLPPGEEGATIAPNAFVRKTPLSWTSGPFPVVGGKTIFPPLAVPVSPKPPPSYLTHWYAGGMYKASWGSYGAMWIFTQITTPGSYPRYDEFYYVLASIWDDIGSYDQIGFTDYYGVWGLTWSLTTGPCSSPTYIYDADAMNLGRGTTYKFYIGVLLGATFFEVFRGSTMIWGAYFPSGAGELYVENEYYCSSDGLYYLGYTDYLEVWFTHSYGGYPSFTFTFTKNQNNPIPIPIWFNAGWDPFETGGCPAAVSVVISGQVVKIVR